MSILKFNKTKHRKHTFLSWLHLLNQHTLNILRNSGKFVNSKYLHMDRLTNFIYKCLWQLLHYLVSLYEFCVWLHLRIISLTLWSYDLCRTSAEREQRDYDFLQQCKQHLKKIPKHLNLIIGPENKQVDDELLTRIFSYALHMNINCVSYYDTRRVYSISSLNSSLTALEELSCPKGWKRKNIDAHHSVWYICKDENTNGNTYNYKMNGVNGSSNATKPTLTNGHSPNALSSPVLETSCLEIYEIQPENNRSLLAKICQDLFKQRHTKEMQCLLENRPLLTERISQELSNHLGNLSEPELSIIFNEDICTFGMLPWHTRFTEFYRHASGQRFDVKTFAHILYKYSRCEQRWGK